MSPLHTDSNTTSAVRKTNASGSVADAARLSVAARDKVPRDSYPRVHMST